jgi:hypothetical protein
MILCACITILCGCTSGPTAIPIELRIATGQHPLGLADEVTLSLADGMDHTLAMLRASPATLQLALDPVPAGENYRLTLLGSFHGDELARGVSCRFDVAPMPSPVPLYLGSVGEFALTGAPSAARMGAVAFADGDRALLVGGDAGQGPTASSEAYAPGTARFTFAESLNVSRAGAVGAKLGDGTPLVIGGAVDFPAVEALNNGAWGPVLTLIPPRLAESAAVTLGDGTVLVCGGRAQAGGAPLDTGWLIGSATGPQSPLVTARAGHTLTLAGDERNAAVYVIGGSGPSGLTADIEIYDPVTSSFASLGLKLATPRRGHSATRLASGRILVAGGSDDSGAVASAEVIDPVARRVLAAGPLRAARSGHSATLLASGRVVIAGGSDGSNALASVEIFDPALGASGSFVDAQPMQSARSGHVVIPLCDGTLLFAGGGPGAERYVQLP